jgi:uncharacterized damage-inducible protein DinB
MLATLTASRDALVESVSSVSEEMASRRPAAERWSIRECVEHVAQAEDYLFGQIEKGTAGEPMANPKREAAIRARGADRTRVVQAPAEGEPKGRFATMAAALEHFLESRARTMEFVENCQADLRCRSTTHPILGPVSCYETLLMMAAHPRRHAAQIAEIREAGGRSQELEVRS